jgi:hypothetical protein
MNNSWLTKPGTLRPAYPHGAIVETSESVYDESPIRLAGDHCDDSAHRATMSSDTNTVQRSGMATN